MSTTETEEEQLPDIELPSMGGGFTLEFVDSKAPEPEDKDKEETPKATKKTVWGPDPCVPEQALNFSDTVRPASFHCEVFNLSLKEDLEKYNKVLSQTGPSGEYRVTVAETQKEFHEGTYFVLVEYAKMEFKQFLDIKKPGDSK